MRPSLVFRLTVIFLTLLSFLFLYFFIRKNRGISFNEGSVSLVKNKRVDEVENGVSSGKINLKKEISPLSIPRRERGPIYVDRYDIFRFRRDKKWIFLTFDGCSLDNCVKPIIGIVEKKRVPVTFFLNGTFIEHFPDSSNLISKCEFVEVGNHLYRHVHLTKWEKLHRHITKDYVNRDFLKRMLLKNEELYFNLTGKRMKKIWRAPYGETNEEIDEWAHEFGYTHISWTRDYELGETLDTLDWLYDERDERYKTNFEILDSILNFGRKRIYGISGGIVLFHLGSKRKKPVYEILPILIDKMRKRGYKFKWVTQGLKNL